MQCTRRNPVQDYCPTGSFMAQLEVSESLGATRAGCSIGKGSQELEVTASSILMGTGQPPVPVQGRQSWLVILTSHSQETGESGFGLAELLRA